MMGSWLMALAGRLFDQLGAARPLMVSLVLGIAFAVSNLAWAAGQPVSSAASGALAQATSDLVPYALLTAACLGTIIALRGFDRESARSVAAQPE
jgi:hypothetical protein